MGRTNLLIFGVLQQKSFQTQSSQTYKLSKSKGKKPLKNRWKHKLCAHIWFPQQQKLSPKIIWNCRPTIHRGNLQSPVNPKFSHLHLQGFGAFHMIENLPKVKKLSYTSNLKLSSCWMIPIIWNNNQNGLKCSITTPCSTRKSGISVAPSDPAFWTPLLGQRLSRHLCLTTFAILRRCPTSCALNGGILGGWNEVVSHLHRKIAWWIDWIIWNGWIKVVTKPSHTDSCGAKSLTSLDRSETLRPQNPGVCQGMCARISADPCITQGERAREVPSGNWVSLLCIGHSCLDAYRVTRDLCLRLWLWCGRTLPRNGVNIGMLLNL